MVGVALVSLKQLLTALALHEALLSSIRKSDTPDTALNRYSFLKASHPFLSDHVDDLCLALAFVFAQFIQSLVSCRYVCMRMQQIHLSLSLRRGMAFQVLLFTVE